MVRDDDAMVPAAFPDKRLYLIDVHGVDLRERFIENVEWSIAQ